MILKELRESLFTSSISLLRASKRSMTGLQYFGFVLVAFFGNPHNIHVLGGKLHENSFFPNVLCEPELFVLYHCLLFYGF